jgi:hypothetical protein
MEEVLIDGGHLVPQHGVEVLYDGRIALHVGLPNVANGILRGCNSGRLPMSTATTEAVAPHLPSV